MVWRIWGLRAGPRSFHTLTHRRAKERSHTWCSLSARWGGPSGACSGATQTEYIESTKEWPDCFKDFEPRARVSGAADNWGDIAGAQSTNQNTDSCILGYLSPTYVDVETFAGSANKFKMKVKATSVNAAHGGPHGWQATAQFGFKLPIPDPCINFTSLADEPCGGGDGGGPPPPPPYTSMNFFPIGPGNTMAFV